MTALKNLLALGAALGIFAMWPAAAGVIVQAQPVPSKDPAVAPTVIPPPQAPSAPTSPGAVVIKFKLEMLDKDRDGFVSRAEAKGSTELTKVFDKLDKNGDRKLDRAELDGYTK